MESLQYDPPPREIRLHHFPERIKGTDRFVKNNPEGCRRGEEVGREVL